jgi:hypothetical protein
MTLLSALSQATAQARMDNHQCVWCGTTLGTHHVDDTFCTSDHQVAWHRWTNGHPLAAATATPSLIEQMTREYEQALARTQAQGIPIATD